MRLLIADSDPTLTELYESYFSDKGYQVVTASNGLQCLRSIREELPDVLVLEHKLPWGGADGVLACLRQDYPFASPEVILLTSQRDPQYSIGGEIPEVDGYLRKPFLMRDLARVIQRVGSQHRAAAQ
ncbi:MAG: Regulator of RpoS [Planctomycetota bacterium]